LINTYNSDVRIEYLFYILPIKSQIGLDDKE